jgi:hypothetical protein
VTFIVFKEDYKIFNAFFKEAVVIEKYILGVLAIIVDAKLGTRL